MLDNGVARSGGDALGGVYYTCQFLRGTSFSGAGACAGYEIRLIQCLVYRNGLNDSVLVSHRGVVNSVIYNNYVDRAGAACDMAGSTSEFGYENCVLYVGGSATSTAYKLNNVKNCVIYRRRPNDTNLLFDEATCANNKFVDTWEATGVDPQTGAVLEGSPAIDFGNTELWTAAAGGVLTDFNGGQRIYNRAIDAGCCEFDWRTTYAAALGVKGATVTMADPCVKLMTETGALTLDAAGAVEATWTAGSVAKVTLPVQVTGEGTLSVTVNGVVQTYTAADDATTLAFKVASGSSNTVRVEWMPEGAGGIASFGPMTVNASFIIILR